MASPRRTVRPEDYPQLDTGEKIVAEAALGRDLAVLTNRRLVVSGRNVEQSLPLANIGLVRVRFERSVRAIVAGAAFLLAAIVLASLVGPVRGAINGQIASMEAAPRAEQSQADPGGLPPATQVIGTLLRGLLAIAALMSPAALFLGLLGLARLGLGLLGETTVSVSAGGAELVYSKWGRDPALRDFVAEVGRNLPAPARTS
ncbi:MAG: PH domain-containing protein [Burkholderiales bacterium]|jgi:hypothetical protein|nr:PH domain-containing protein [Burkholderiales bacterium]